MMDTDVRIVCGPYSDDLGKFLSRMDGQLTYMNMEIRELENRLAKLEHTISLVKKIVPLVDEDLGMYPRQEG